MKTYLLCLTVLIIAAVMLMADGQTDAAASQKHMITVWFNAGLGNALNSMERNIEDFHNAQDSYVVEMTLVPLRSERILRWTTIHNGVPARKSALAQSALYQPGGPLHV